MTTYAYRRTLDDGEMIAVKEALEFCVKFSETKQPVVPQTKFRPNIRVIEAVLSDLSYHPIMTLNDREMSPVKEALEFYVRYLGDNWLADPQTENPPSSEAIQDVLLGWYGDIEMTSTSSSCWPKKTG